jgi:hypothetical protein
MIKTALFPLDVPVSSGAGTMSVSYKCSQMINTSLFLLDVPVSCGDSTGSVSYTSSQMITELCVYWTGQYQVEIALGVSATHLDK